MGDKRKMTEEHRIIKRTELDVYYVESGDEKRIGEFTVPLYIRKTKHYEYEQFHCDIKHKNGNLGNWDFNYCPFCGKEIKEK